MRIFVSRFLRHRGAATAIEYALIASLIAVVIAVAVGTVGQALNGIFGQVQSAFPAA